MSSSVVSSVGGSYFTWFQDEVLPYLIATFDIIITLVSLTLSIVMLVTFKKRKLLTEPSNRFIFQLTLVDIFACIFILIPGSVVAIMKKWELTVYVCYAHAVIATWLYLLTFALIISMIVERTVKKKNTSLYKKTFATSRFIGTLSSLLWILLFPISMIPMTGFGNISYDFYQAACVVTHESNIYYLCLVFTLGIVFSTITAVICYSILAHAHFKTPARTKPETTTPRNNLECISDTESVFDSSEITSGNVDTARTDTTTGSSKFTATVGIGNEASSRKDSKLRLSSLTGIKKLKTAVTKLNSVSSFQAMKSLEKDPDIHLAVTYLILWFTITFCWLPYFIVSFYHAVNYDVGFWRGYFTITVIIANISYLVKPIIYLSHNKHYREYTKNTIPKNVYSKASSVRMSISSVVDMMDKAIFKSTPANKKFNAALKAHSIGKNWIKKTRDHRNITSVDRNNADLKENKNEGVQIIGMATFNRNEPVSQNQDHGDKSDVYSNNEFMVPEETLDKSKKNDLYSTETVHSNSHTVSVHLGDVDDFMTPISPKDDQSCLSPKTARDVDMDLL